MFLYLLTLLTLLVSWYIWKKIRLMSRLPPGPNGLPVLGYLPWIDAKAPFQTLTSLSSLYGSIYSLQMGSVFTVVLTDHKLIRQALARDVFSGRAPLYLTHGIMKGYGLICAEGDLWKDQRKFVSSSLKSFGMVRFGPKRDKMEQRIAVGVKECVEKLNRLTSPCDPQPALLHCLGNVVNSLVFGHTWSEDDPTWLWLQHLQEEGTKLIGVAGPINFLPFLRVFPEYKKTMRFLMEGKEKTHVVYDNMIQERKKKRGEGSGPGDDMIDAFLAEMSRRQASGHGDEGFYTVSQFHHLLADLFGAGVDTTLTTLRWFLLFMAQNPDVQTRVQEELDGVLQGRPLTLEDVAVLPYTEAALAETQRIRSVVPLGIPHGALEDTELAGYHIPRGTMLVPLQWAVHMDPKLWPEPDRFNPGRFLTEDDRFYKPEAFIPFQTGKRICVGEELGRMLLFLFGATIVHQFRLSPPDGAQLDMEGDVGITLTPRPQSLLFTARFETTR